MAKKNNLTEWLQRVRKTGEYSDVLVRVNGKEFHLHMLPLQNASAYFRNLPGPSDGAAALHELTGCKLVTIHDLPGIPMHSSPKFPSPSSLTFAPHFAASTTKHVF